MQKLNGYYGLGVSILFVLLGLYLIFEKSNQSNVTYPVWIKITGIACVLFFGSLVIMKLLKYLKK